MTSQCLKEGVKMTRNGTRDEMDKTMRIAIDVVWATTLIFLTFSRHQSYEKK